MSLNYLFTYRIHCHHLSVFKVESSLSYYLQMLHISFTFEHFHLFQSLFKHYSKKILITTTG